MRNFTTVLRGAEEGLPMPRAVLRLSSSARLWLTAQVAERDALYQHRQGGTDAHAGTAGAFRSVPQGVMLSRLAS